MSWKYEIFPRLLVTMQRHYRLADYRVKASRLESVYQSARNELIALKALMSWLEELKISGVAPHKAPGAKLVREGVKVTHVSFTEFPFTAVYRLDHSLRVAMMVAFDRKGDTIPEYKNSSYRESDR